MKPRVIVVEDEAAIQDLIVEELEEAGYEVARAANGREALDVVPEFRPHLILSDISMPDMDGYEMLAALREGPMRLQGVPVVFLSALADRRHVIEGKRHGADDYVTKPIDFELLLATIEARLREVERLTELKERQMAKLYDSFLERSAESGRSKPGLLVVNQWIDLNPVHAALERLSIPYVVHHRGARLDDYLSGREYSVVLISDHADDVSVKLAFMASSALRFHRGPTVILVEDKTRPGLAELEQLGPVIPLEDCPDALVVYLSDRIASAAA